MLYLVTKQFTSGLLAGITIQERSDVAFTIGAVIERSAISPSSYVVLECEVAA